MNKMWEIRESKPSRYGYKHDDRSEVEEAYECGFEDGYREAMKELTYGEKRMRRY